MNNQDEKMLIMKPIGSSKSNSMTGLKINKFYGSFDSSKSRPISYDTFRKHTVSSTDTLQGIALKYGTTTEELRRLNRLWYTDNLFMKPTIFVPITDSNFLKDCDLITETDNSLDPDVSTDCKHLSNGLNITDSCLSFLSKIDSSIQKSKKQMEIIQGYKNADEFKEPLNNYNNNESVKQSPNTMHYFKNKIRSSFRNSTEEQDMIYNL